VTQVVLKEREVVETTEVSVVPRIGTVIQVNGAAEVVEWLMWVLPGKVVVVVQA